MSDFDLPKKFRCDEGTIIVVLTYMDDMRLGVATMTLYARHDMTRMNNTIINWTARVDKLLTCRVEGFVYINRWWLMKLINRSKALMGKGTFN